MAKKQKTVISNNPEAGGLYSHEAESALISYLMSNKAPDIDDVLRTPAPQQNNTVPPQFAHLFSHQATGDQNNSQQFNAGGQGTALDQAFGKLAAAQETK